MPRDESLANKVRASAAQILGREEARPDPHRLPVMSWHRDQGRGSADSAAPGAARGRTAGGPRQHVFHSPLQVGLRVGFTTGSDQAGPAQPESGRRTGRLRVLATVTRTERIVPRPGQAAAPAAAVTDGHGDEPG